MSYGYLGEMTNRNLNDVRNYDGYFEVNNPGIVSTFNNYPDDSHILQKILYNTAELNAKFKIYTDNPNYITEEVKQKIKQLHEAVFQHLSGMGEKCIVGILEVKSASVENNEEGMCLQRFYRANDNVSFIRTYFDGNWSEWKYELDDEKIYLQLADDVIIDKDNDSLIRGFRYYAPPYDDSRIKAEISRRVTVDEFETKLKKNNTIINGRLRIDGGGTLVTNGRLVLAANGTGGDGSFIHSSADGGHNQQHFRSYDGPSLGVGHNNYTQIVFTTPGRGGQGIYPTNIFWNDPNNLDYEIQTLSRLRFKDLEGNWPHRPEWGDRAIPVQGLHWNMGEDILIQHAPLNTGNIYGYGMGSFILPANPRENYDIWLTGKDAAWDGSDQPLLNCRIRIWWNGDTMMVGANGIVFRVYAR